MEIRANQFTFQLKETLRIDGVLYIITHIDVSNDGFDIYTLNKTTDFTKK